MKITIHVFENEKEILSKKFTDGVYVIGRGEECELQLDNRKVSRRHIELRITEAGVYLSNLSQGGKLYINQEALETAEAQSGDAIRLGPYRLVFHFGTVSQAKDSKIIEVPAEPELPPGDPLGIEIPLDSHQDHSSIAPAPISSENSAPAFQGSAALNLDTQVNIKPVVAKLIFTDGPLKDKEFFLETYEITFGRSRKADIFLDDDKLSRIHAKISRVGNGYRLIDLGSRNGTFVNGVRVLEHPLNSFDEIQFGASKIKFIVQDLNSQIHRAGTGLVSAEQTKSVQWDTQQARDLIHALEEDSPVAPAPVKKQIDYKELARSPKFKRFLMGGIVVGLLLLLLLPEGNKSSSQIKTIPTPLAPTLPILPDASTSISKEYSSLPMEAQRAIEGMYQSAIRAANNDLYEEALFHLRQIHEKLPYYKNSRDLFADYNKKLKAQQIADAEKKAKSDDKQDLQISINEGLRYLKESKWDKAEDAFNTAIVIDPNHPVALKGLEAAQKKVTDIRKIPPDRNPEQEKRQKVADLFNKAIAAFKAKSYQEAIQTAEAIRQIEIKGETKYLSEAKQIIDLAKLQQKEEFEPFLVQAKEKYAEGDYNTARDLCEEMVKRDPAYSEAVDLLVRVKRQMHRLAKESYTLGYILESMNKLDEAVQHWNRAKTYIRPGDEYYQKVIKKLEYYQ